MERRPWNLAEVRLLYRQRHRAGFRQIAAELGREEADVRRLAAELGLSDRPGGDPGRRIYVQHRFVGRARADICRELELSMLDVTRLEDEFAARAAEQPAVLEAAEDDFLRDWHGKLSPAALGARLGREPSWVEKRLGKLKLKTIRAPAGTKEEAVEAIGRYLSSAKGAKLWREGAVLEIQPALYETAVRHFGSWREAVAEARRRRRSLEASPSVEKRRVRAELGKRLGDERPVDAGMIDVVHSILRRSTAGESLDALVVAREDRDLLMAANATFGSWNQALAMAGLQVDGERRSK